MKVMVGYVPLPSPKGVALLSQNRQFQWFNRPTYIYPMVPAWAATLADQAGHRVCWADGIAEGWNPATFERHYKAFAPDLFLLETKTPVVKATWRAVARLKSLHPSGRIALCGDHVTALPEESLRHSPADFILTGGDFDFLLMELLEALERQAPYPPGVWWREGDTLHNSGPFVLSHDLNRLPFINRDLTRWQLYSRENGNFRHPPGTYIMAGRDCWWGKCAFCSWTTLYTGWRARDPERVLDEIGHILEQTTVREIFDDTGCFPAGAWLRRFCEGMVARGYHRRVTMGCNMIPGILNAEQYQSMARAGFRFVLFGLESADQDTLQRIRKCGRARDLESSMRMARKAGLLPHVTCMVGYPWETREQARRTIALTRRLFRQGDIESLQATIVVPYPGTPLFDECRRNGWLKTENWDRYDMREPVMRTGMRDAEILALTRSIYRSFLTPRFLLRKLLAIRSWRDIAFYWRAGCRVIGHLLDFRTTPRPDTQGKTPHAEQNQTST